MADLTATFETGINGNDILTTDAGSATAWDGFAGGLGATVKYSSAQKVNGTLSSLFAAGAAPSYAVLRWSTVFGTQTDHYGRVYIYVPAYPPTAATLVIDAGNGAAPKWSIVLSVAGKLQFNQGAGLSTLLGTSTTTIPLNQWVRLEYHVLNSTTVGVLQTRIFNTYNSLTPDETFTVSGVNNGVNTTAVEFGLNILAQAFWANFSVYMDDIIAGATDWPTLLTFTDIMLPRAMIVR